jgi:hypothetical protein
MNLIRKNNGQFTKEQLDLFFQIDDVGKFLDNEFPTSRGENWINPYDYIVYPLYRKEGPWYRCEIHSQVTTGEARHQNQKQLQKVWMNTNFSSFVHHILTYHPEEHKEYIERKLFKKQEDVQPIKQFGKRKPILPARNPNISPRPLR